MARISHRKYAKAPEGKDKKDQPQTHTDGECFCPGDLPAQKLRALRAAGFKLLRILVFNRGLVWDRRGVAGQKSRAHRADGFSPVRSTGEKLVVVCARPVEFCEADPALPGFNRVDQCLSC